MRTEEIMTALRRLKVETGSLVCMGCGREHDCGVHGCRIVREAAELIEKLADRCARYVEEIAVLQELETDYIDMEYDEDADAYIIPEGWWESIEFGETFSAVDMPVLAWRPLPDGPEVE